MIRTLLLIFVAGCSATASTEPLAPGATARHEATAASPGPAPGGQSTDAAVEPTASPAPSESAGTPSPSSSFGAKSELTADKIKQVVRANYGTMTACYIAGLKRDPSLAGTIDVRLAIDDNGEVVAASAPKGVAKKGDDRLLDAQVVGCVEKAFMRIVFPPTGRGLMTFTYPVVFRVE